MEVLDQLGAFLGPVIIFLMSYFAKSDSEIGTYHKAFAILFIPALITIALVLFSWRKYPHPEVFEKKRVRRVKRSSRFVFLLFSL